MIKKIFTFERLNPERDWYYAGKILKTLDWLNWLLTKVTKFFLWAFGNRLEIDSLSFSVENVLKFLILLPPK